MLCYGDKGHLHDCGCMRRGPSGYGAIACTHAYVRRLYSMKDKAGHYTIAQLSIKPAMFVSSVQAVVACYVTVLRVCTLVLFIFSAQA